MEIETLFLNEVIQKFRTQQEMAERAIRQVSDAKLREALNPETNSPVVIMKHVAGNLLSRWTDFLTSDGEKAWRDRDTEFVDDFGSRAEAAAYWEKGWACLFDALGSLSEGDLSRTVEIRSEPHTVVKAIIRALDHCGYHVGQIVMICRIHAGADWETLTIPRGGSEAFNRMKRGER